MRDIGNGDTELKATLSLFTPHGIIKISRVFSVDGDKRHITQIDPMMFIVLGGLLSESTGLAQDFVGPFVGNTVGTNGHIDLKAGIKVITEHFHYLTFGTQLC